MRKKGLYLLLAFSMGMASANVPSFQPAQSLLLKRGVPKHNVFALFDDSASIATGEVWVSEHFYGFGKPVCSKPDNWSNIKNQPKYQNGGTYYDPFGTGSYLPYNPNVLDSGYDGSIYVEKCALVKRGQAFRGLLEQFLAQYKGKYFLGYGALGKDNTASLATNIDASNKRFEVINSEVKDLSELNIASWQKIYNNLAITFSESNMRIGWSPIFPALYNLSLYFRGYPYPVGSYGAMHGYAFRQALPGDAYNPNPLRFRCAKNNIIMFTDGRANKSYIDVFANKDAADLGGFGNMGYRVSVPMSHDVSTGGSSSYPSLLSASLDKIFLNNSYKYLAYVEDGYTGSEDGKTFTPGTKEYDRLDKNRYDYEGMAYKIPANTFRKIFKKNLMQNTDIPFPSVDATGNPWSAEPSEPQVLTLSAIIFSDKPYQPFTDLIKETGGIGIEQDNIIDHGVIFEKVDSMLSQTGSDLEYSNGKSIEDQYMRSPNTIRYIFKHDIDSNIGNIEAYTLSNDNIQWKKQPEWTAYQRINPLEGRFMTMKYLNERQKSSASLVLDSIKTAFLNKESESTKKLDAVYLDWLKGMATVNSGKSSGDLLLKARNAKIGPIVNSTPAYVATDREYINLDFVSDDLKKEFEEYVVNKTRHMRDDLLVVNANDGLVHFIHATRKDQLSNNLGGSRKAAYFPGFLAHRLMDIVDITKPFRYTMDGFTNIFEFKGSDGGIQTVGMSGMGAGGQGIVGYRIFKMNGNNANRNIVPLFEISNEQNFKYNTKGFEHLGYTYSGFEFYNRAHPDAGVGMGQGVAVFGNGYGHNESTLYLIDVENGALIKEITLNDEGGGASTPALIVSNDKETGFQKLDGIVVGDQSGRLYYVSDVNSEDPAVAVMYEPQTLFVQPISTRPMVAKPQESEKLWVFFGTGRKADEKWDRAAKSKLHQQYFIGIPLDSRGMNVDGLFYKTYSVNNGEISVSDDRSVPNGWYYALSNGSSGHYEGERLVYQPAVSIYNNDIVFSTWGVDEGVDDDICMDDIGFGKQFALEGATGNQGEFKSHQKPVAGVMVAGRTPGVPSGSQISYLGEYTGAVDHSGRSTMGAEAINNLNAIFNAYTSHAGSSYLNKCVATTDGEVLGEMPQFCHDLEKKRLIRKRISIQNIQ